MWKIKNKEAVSPVIGVILMVAITVVLAAVLYVWVSGFMTTTSGGVYAVSTGAPSVNATNVVTASVISTQPASGIKGTAVSWQLWNTGTSLATVPIVSGYTETGTPVTSWAASDSYLKAGCTIKVTPGAGTFTLRAIVGGSQIYESAAFTTTA
ncbi:MAG: type IV pilin N-terminal domain-containing protein [Thermoplasmatales archaeon]|nr:type IV pilin N-terminal domain-containing protein [Thermoplasmatales archaeon]